jgi:hypothetical protein
MRGNGGSLQQMAASSNNREHVTNKGGLEDNNAMARQIDE